MSDRSYLQHGRRHGPNGSDPIPGVGLAFGDWIYVDSGAPAPAFQNGFTNVGGSAVPMRYRFLGLETDPDTPIEIEGAVTGGAWGDVIFTLLYSDGSAYALDYDLVLPASDSSGIYVPLKILTDGDVIYGVV